MSDQKQRLTIEVVLDADKLATAKSAMEAIFTGLRDAQVRGELVGDIRCALVDIERYSEGLLRDPKGRV